MKKKSIKEIILVSSMFFGMLFGAGNLIFPVSMGQRAGVEVFVATLGFCITGVGLPLLSVLALSSSNSASVTDMAKLVGKKFSIFFTTALYLCIGPLFAIPRTATVPFQVGVVPFLPEDTKQGMLFLFSFLFFVFALILSLKPGKLLTYVGKVLNPLFLLFLGILLFVAVLFPIGGLHALNPVSGYEKGSFLKGIFEGYNTMDVRECIDSDHPFYAGKRGKYGRGKCGRRECGRRGGKALSFRDGSFRKSCGAPYGVALLCSELCRCGEPPGFFCAGKWRRYLAFSFYVLFSSLWRNSACGDYLFFLFENSGGINQFRGNGVSGDVSGAFLLSDLCLSFYDLFFRDIEYRPEPYHSVCGSGAVLYLSDLHRVDYPLPFWKSLFV